MMEELLQQANHHKATVSVNEVQPYTMQRLNEVTDEDIISIEDTYRETNAMVGNQLQNDSSLPIGNKSMTIIQEEEGEYEES